MAFLEELHEKTKQHIPFEETEYYRDLCLLCEEMNNLPGFETRPIVEGVSKVLNFYVHREVVFFFITPTSRHGTYMWKKAAYMPLTLNTPSVLIRLIWIISTSSRKPPFLRNI